MKPWLFALWLLAPVGVAAYHLGPGQDGLRGDEAADLLALGASHAERAAELARDARDLEAAGEWARAKEAYLAALEVLPDGAVAASRAARLELARCRMQSSELPQAHAELRDLVDELAADEEADPALLAAARSAYASSQYYMTWLMRLEGEPREQWEPFIESARQLYKLLALESDDPTARRGHEEDLEAAVRLARMDLSELQGLPLPSQ